MITQLDCLTLLTQLEDSGVNIGNNIKLLLSTKEKDTVPLDVLKFISDNKGIEATLFYDFLRKKHNLHKSQLYTNIINFEKKPENIITTLTCLLTQIILYSNKLTDSTLFIKEVRAADIASALENYFKTFELDNALKLINVIRSEILVLEYLAGRRELA